MKIKFAKGVKGPLRVSNGQAYERVFDGHKPYDVEPSDWPILQRARATVEQGKDDDGKPAFVSVQAFEVMEGADTKPAETATPAAPARPVPVESPRAAEPKGGK